MKKISLFLLPLIIFTAFLLGARMILAEDFYYLFDQARDYLLTQDIVNNHSMTLIGTHSGLGGFFHGPLWLYMLTPVYIIFKGDPFGFTYFYIGLHLLTVLTAYIAGKKLYSGKLGLLIAFFVAIAPTIWKSVPNTIGVNVVPLVFICLIYFLIKFIRGDAKSFILISFFAGITLQFETALPLVLVPSLIVVAILNRKKFSNLKIILLSVFAYALSVANFILFDLRHSFLMTKSVIGAFGGGVEKGKGYLDFPQRIIEHMNSLGGVYKGILFKDELILSLLLVAIFSLGIFVSWKEKNKFFKELLVLLLFPVLVFIFFTFYPYPIWPEYVFGLLIPVVFGFSIAIKYAWNLTVGKLIIIIFFLVTLFNVAQQLGNLYLRPYPQSTSGGSYLNQKALIDWIYKDANQDASRNGTFGYFVYTPEIYTHGTDYLISWYGKYYPDIKFENKKHKITYLVMAPHLDNDEGAHVFWKKNTIKTNGKVLISKIFRGGVTVEKLLIEKDEPPVDPNYYQGLIFR